MRSGLGGVEKKEGEAKKRKETKDGSLLAFAMLSNRLAQTTPSLDSQMISSSPVAHV